MKSHLLYLTFFFGCISNIYSQNYSEILGRPTNNSVTMNILFDQKVEVYWEIGSASGVYTISTNHFNADANVPLVTDFTGLLANTRYFYHTLYRSYGSSSVFTVSSEHSFVTQRSKGASFTFAVEADPHMDTNTIPSAYSLTLQNIAGRRPDFLIDLGDIFMSEKLPKKSQTEITNRHLLYRPYFNPVCNSAPLYLVLGNHEGEQGWSNNGSDTCLPVRAANTRNYYYPNPKPNKFYSGDTIAQPYVGLRADYYAWEWGDALFVVLDPYWYTTIRPDWGWTLGEDQYKWFNKVLTSSKAKYKFVFCHQVVGGRGSDGRGGAEFVDFYEMGGENTDSSWGFDTYRSGWGKPIHQIMKENGVDIYFHGHDHFYDMQDKDGIVYLEVPQPGAKNITNLQASQYGYTSGTIFPSRGYILISVSDTAVTSEYISTYLPNEENASRKNGDVRTSFTLKSLPTAIQSNSNKDVSLLQNYPNPFHGQTNITYTLKSNELVNISVYDIFGRELTNLINKIQSAGTYTINFNVPAISYPSGIYFCRLSTSGYTKTIKMISY